MSQLRLMIVRSILVGLIFLAGFLVGWLVFKEQTPFSLENPFGGEISHTSKQTTGKLGDNKSLTYLPYTIKNLQNYDYQAIPVVITKQISKEDEYTSYEFTYHPLGKKMTGMLNVPNDLSKNPKAIVLIRGWAPQATYYTGMGTKNAANTFAKNGYITLAPDFFGYGESDPEPEDPWIARFEKPIIVIELLKSINESGVPLPRTGEIASTPETPTKKIKNIGIWAHSNGGQIALTTLEVGGFKYPTTLWAPVVAPFPYSVLYFSDEEEDEGKQSRKFIALLEERYDVFDFSLTQHLSLLQAPFQLHHGTADEAAPLEWSIEFFAKVDKENKRRKEITSQLSTLEKQLKDPDLASDEAKIASIEAQIKELSNQNALSPIEYQFFKHPGANHNMVPSWNEAIEQDLKFFTEKL